MNSMIYSGSMITRMGPKSKENFLSWEHCGKPTAITRSGYWNST